MVVEDPAKQEEITAVITDAVEGSSHKRTFGKEINYSLPFDQSANFASGYKWTVCFDIWPHIEFLGYQIYILLLVGVKSA